MRSTGPIVLAAALAACGGKARESTTPAPAETPAAKPAGLQIGLTTVYVDDQEQALRFYTEVLGFAEKDDFSNSGYRWLTVMAPGDDQGPSLQLAADTDPAAAAFQQAMFDQGQPAVMFFTDDIQADFARIEAAGGEFTMAPTEVMAGSVIATLKDGVGNLVQITQLAD